MNYKNKTLIHNIIIVDFFVEIIILAFVINNLHKKGFKISLSSIFTINRFMHIVKTIFGTNIFFIQSVT